MVFAVLLTLFPLVALSACPQGDGNCPAHVGRGLLQVSIESTVATQVSGETAKRLVQGLHVNTTDIGIYLQSLVAKVDGHNYTLSKPEKTALETIGLMVGKMQNASVMQHAEDQQEVNRMRDLIQNCTSDAAASLAKVAAFKESASSTRKTHAACRQVEGSANDDKTLACTTYHAHRATTTPPTCMSTELSAEYVKTDDATKKKQMETCLVMVKSWLTPFHDKYEECKSKTDTHNNQTAECGSQQQAFEQTFCLYESKFDDTCTAQNSCREKMIAARNSSHDGVKFAEAARKADFTASNRLLCFLDVLRANNTHKRKTLLECQNQSKQTSQFDIVYQGIPGAADCQPELTKPCDSSWQLQEYQSQAWHSKAKMEVCTPCQAPTTTTTTTQEAVTTLRKDFDLLGHSSSPTLPFVSPGGLGNWTFASSNSITATGDETVLQWDTASNGVRVGSTFTSGSSSNYGLPAIGPAGGSCLITPCSTEGVPDSQSISIHPGATDAKNLVVKFTAADDVVVSGYVHELGRHCGGIDIYFYKDAEMIASRVALNNDSAFEIPQTGMQAGSSSRVIIGRSGWYGCDHSSISLAIQRATNTTLEATTSTVTTTITTTQACVNPDYPHRSQHADHWPKAPNGPKICYSLSSYAEGVTTENGCQDWCCIDNSCTAGCSVQPCQTAL